MKPFVRAFIAVDISPSVRTEARKALKDVAAAFPNVKWVDDENFHVTLKFLGSVPTTDLHRVVRAVETACRGFEQFDLLFEGVGAFPNAENPRTIWIGVGDGVREIRRLASRIDDEMAKIGYPPENREFSPHLTVGRARQKDREESFAGGLSRMISERANVFIGTSPVDAVVVYSSELERGGPKYEALAEIELSPLGSGDEDDADAFDPRNFDDEAELKRVADADAADLTAHFPEKLDSGFDVDALDEDVEAELRRICGGEFVDRSNAKKNAAKNGGSGKLGKPSRPRPGAKPAFPTVDDVPELDELDLSEFDFFRGAQKNGATQNSNKRRPPRRK